MGKLDGKTALITGASKGIGEGIARTFVKHGARVVLAAAARGWRIWPPSSAPREPRLWPSAWMCPIWTASVPAMRPGVKEFGQIDILVSNAGICRLGDFLTQSDEDRDAHLDINVKGAWNTCKAVLPGMVERKWGKIVIMSSVTGDMVADPGEAAYAMSKAALVGLTKALAREFAPCVNVNAICPGYVLTPMVRGMADQSCPENPQSVIDGIAASIPLGRLADPREVGELAAFLSSDEASYLTGCPVRHRRGLYPAETSTMGV